MALSKHLNKPMENKFVHPAYKTSSEEPQTAQELEEAKIAAGVTTHEDAIKRLKEAEPGWENKEKEGDYEFESFVRIMGRGNKDETEEAFMEMKNFKGDINELFDLAINKSLEMADGNPDKVLDLASKLDSLKCAHLLLKKYEENYPIEITRLPDFFKQVNFRADDEKAGPAFWGTAVMIKKALQDYAETKPRLTLDQILDLSACCQYDAKKYPRVELETKMLEELSPWLKDMSVSSYIEIQKKLPSNLMKYESLVSFVDENEGTLDLCDIVTLMDTVTLGDFFKELRDGTLVSMVMSCEDKIENGTIEDAEKLKTHIGRLSEKARKSPAMTSLLAAIDKKLEEKTVSVESSK